jgi:hypothetical protein
MVCVVYHLKSSCQSYISCHKLSMLKLTMGTIVEAFYHGKLSHRYQLGINMPPCQSQRSDPPASWNRELPRPCHAQLSLCTLSKTIKRKNWKKMPIGDFHSSQTYKSHFWSSQIRVSYIYIYRWENLFKQRPDWICQTPNDQTEVEELCASIEIPFCFATVHLSSSIWDLQLKNIPTVF